MNNDRLDYIKQYFKQQEQQKVKVEVPVQVSKTTKGNVNYYFDGYRCGYKFTRGIAWVERKDLHLFLENFPYMIIHDEKEDGSQ